MCSIRQNVFKVDAKFKEFVTIVRKNYINNKYDTLKKLRDKTLLIE